MKHNVGNLLAIALLCGGLFTGCALSGGDTTDGTASADMDAYMTYMHHIATGAGGGLLPGRTFPFVTEDLIRVGVSAGATPYSGNSTTVR